MYKVETAAGGGSSYTEIANYTFDNNDNIVKASYGNGMYNEYKYNAGNLVTDMKLAASPTNVCQTMSYTYRQDGNMSGKTETINGKTVQTAYTYDSTNRLILENTTGAETYSLAYEYDGAGNRSKLSYTSGNEVYSKTYTYDADNRLLRTVKNDGTPVLINTDYDYDKNGNQTSVESYTDNKVGNTGTGTFKLNVVSGDENSDTKAERFTYDGFNRLIGYTNTNGSYNDKMGISATYSYYADGLRASKSVNGLETGYLWEGDNIYAELDSSNNITESYYRGYQLISDSSDNYYMHNAHGDVISVYNGTKLADNYTYDAFGNSDSQMKFGYCDQQYDFETGLYYMRARYYNPSIGRFTSEDIHWNPYNAIYGDRKFEDDETKYPDCRAVLQSENLYVYCIGNPICYIDKNGFTVLVLGSSVAAQFGFKISGGTSICIDDNFNVGVVDSISIASGTSAGISLSESLSILDLDSISDLNGLSVEIGGSISPIIVGPVSFGGGVDVTSSFENNEASLGAILTISGSVGVGFVDAHAQITYSSVQEGWGYVISQVVGGSSLRQIYSMVKGVIDSLLS